jgi:hypothetical protein
MGFIYCQRRRLGAAVLEGKRRGDEGTTRGAAVRVRARHSSRPAVRGMGLLLLNYYDTTSTNLLTLTPSREWLILGHV